MCHWLCKTCFELATEQKKKKKARKISEQMSRVHTEETIAELMYKCRIIARDKYKYDDA